MSDPNLVTLSVDGGGLAKLTIGVAHDEIGPLSAPLRAALLEAIEEVARGESITGVLLSFTSPTPRTLGSGAAEIANAARPGNSPLQARDVSRSFQAALRRLETCGKPIVVLLEGAISGGRLEVALACHYRVMTEDATMVLDETGHGAMFCGGGTQRLPRLVGVAKALPWLMQGGEIAAPEALRLKLVHAIAPIGEGENLARTWLATRPAPSQPWDHRGFIVPGGSGPLAPFAPQLFMAGVARLRARGEPRHSRSLNILSCVYEGTIIGFDAALRIESNYFARLISLSTRP